MVFTLDLKNLENLVLSNLTFGFIGLLTLSILKKKIQNFKKPVLITRDIIIKNNH